MSLPLLFAYTLLLMISQFKNLSSIILKAMPAFTPKKRLPNSKRKTLPDNIPKYYF